MSNTRIRNFGIKPPGSHTNCANTHYTGSSVEFALVRACRSKKKIYIQFSRAILLCICLRFYFRVIRLKKKHVFNIY